MKKNEEEEEEEGGYYIDGLDGRLALRALARRVRVGDVKVVVVRR